MTSTGFSEIVTALQVAISPVILISGVGMLLLVMTNRMGRVIDRSRHLAAQAGRDGAVSPSVRQQVDILYRRARVLRLAIGLASGSALFSALLVIAAFLIALGHPSAVVVLPVLFIASMICLIGSLAALIRDIHFSLSALKLELRAADLL